MNIYDKQKLNLELISQKSKGVSDEELITKLAAKYGCRENYVKQQIELLRKAGYIR